MKSAHLASHSCPGPFIAVAADTGSAILRKPFSVYTVNPDAGEISILFSVYGPTTTAMSRMLSGDTNLNDLFSTLFGGANQDATGFARGARNPRAAAPQEVDVTITLTEAISGVSRQLNIVGGRQPITFNVPASIKDGAKLRLPATTSRPEIIATVHISNPYGFDRKEDNLVVDVSVPFTTCAIGGEIIAVTPSGDRKTLRLPAGTQGGQQLRITGHGMTKGAGNPRGDMLVRIKVEVPKNLTTRQRAAMDELAAALEEIN